MITVATDTNFLSFQFTWLKYFLEVLEGFRVMTIMKEAATTLLLMKEAATILITRVITMTTTKTLASTVFNLNG